MARFYMHPDTKKMIPEEEYREIMSQRREDKSTAEFLGQSFTLKGHGFPSKDLEMRRKQRKALQKNPNHTTMQDYKFSNPDSVPSKALKKNKKKLEKAGINIKKNES